MLRTRARRTANRQSRMTQLATTTRDDKRLCRTIQLPNGEILERDRRDLARWHSSQGRHSGPLLELICANADAHDLAHARSGYPQDHVAARAVAGVRQLHGRRFLRSVAPGHGGFIIHDELDDPVRGDAETVIGPGASVQDAATITDPIVRAWSGLGPTPADMRRSYAASALLAYALNRRLGVEYGEVRQEWIRHVPTRPWRLHETADTTLLVDAHGEEVLSLRSPRSRAGAGVTGDEIAASRRLLEAANAVPPHGDAP